ncbi:uncharacterized protein LOC111611997 [Xiphophorus maculatus]|uniref:uncharacterized protein LOC111611997 n=1 Tax=Xiphophorus maculatus TaxID=8083 RepID=UPI000C6EEAF0|nr:uncharacterized protein LOC111611997 [Xiphophorus maculatus]
MSATRSQRAKRNPKHDASYYCSLGEDKEGFDENTLIHLKVGVCTVAGAFKKEILIEYRGEVISRKEQENRLKIYHDALEAFMFDFKFNGQQLCVDAAREDGSLGRLVNDEEMNPNSKLKVTRVDGRPHLCLFALKDIGPGEEITYVYGDSDWPWRRKISKDELCQAVDVDACGSCSTNPPEISKDERCQAGDVDACGSCSTNPPEISIEEPCQAGHVDAYRSCSTNPPEISKEELCQAGEVDACRTCSTNPAEHKVNTEMVRGKNSTEN